MNGGCTVVVGAGSGTGAEIARRFAAEGYAVALARRDADALSRPAARDPPSLISKSPWRRIQWFDIVKWSQFAMIEAEERGVGSQNVDAMLSSTDPNIKRLLGVTPGLGGALGLDDRWAYTIIKQVGNYGESFDRNVGAGSQLKLPRGLNALWTQGGLMYAMPFR